MDASHQILTEQEFRTHIKKVSDRVLARLDSMDPDVVECQSQFGALTIIFSKGQRMILSAQPSVRQIWLAVAHLGKAHHFRYDQSTGQWLDEKNPDVELVQLLQKYLREQLNIGDLCL